MDKLDISLLGLPLNKEKQLRNKKIEDLHTLVRYTPNKYFNLKQKSTPIGDIDATWEGRVVEVIGTLKDIRSNGYNGMTMAKLEDDTGTISITWFNQLYLSSQLHQGLTYSIVGKINVFYGHVSIQAPISCSSDPRDFHRIIPQYTVIRGMSQEYIQNCIEKSQEEIKNLSEDYLTEEQLKLLGVPNEVDYISMIHFPKNLKEINMAARRYVVDNLYPFAAKMAYKQRYSDEHSRFFITKTNETENFIKNLPFPLTPDQKDAVDKLLVLMKEGKVVNALVQGDVGCGAMCFSYTNSEKKKNETFR